MSFRSFAEVSVREQARAVVKLCVDYTPGLAEIASGLLPTLSACATTDKQDFVSKEGYDRPGVVGFGVRGVRRHEADSAAREPGEEAGGG